MIEMEGGGSGEGVHFLEQSRMLTAKGNGKDKVKWRVLARAG